MNVRKSITRKTTKMMLQVFEYVEELDAFKVHPKFAEICGRLQLNEWGIGPIFIGRYLCMDNDFGEHFSDNWELREARDSEIKSSEFEAEELFFIEPERFSDGRDGPCHSPEMRKMFWTEVFKSLQLSCDFLFKEARSNYERGVRLKSREEERFAQIVEKEIESISKEMGC